MKNWNYPKLADVTFEDLFFAPRIRKNREVTIPSAIARCRETGRWDTFKKLWKPGMDNEPHMYWDSDVGKVLEGIANVLVVTKDSVLEAEADALIDDIASAQEPDGYLNVYFSIVHPEQRWKRLNDGHELYCAGHLAEAAVAYYEATGKRKLLDVICRYVDLIVKLFGREPGQLRGYPGHPELELALVRLYRATKNQKYLDLASYFIEERGTHPCYFLKEPIRTSLENLLADKPLRQQTRASGHAVRAVYLYRGAAEVAKETGDKGLLELCARIFQNIAERHMYVTGGVGASPRGESFSNDFDLPNQYGYAESCASIGLVNFACCMLNQTGEAKYAEIMERALFNGAISGLSISGNEFFYSNPLEVNPSMQEFGHIQRRRSPWFNTSCCPTSYCRFLSGLARYFHSWNEEGIRIHIPTACNLNLPPGTLKIESHYPWVGKVRITLLSGGCYTLGIRMPEEIFINLNDRVLEGRRSSGYSEFRRNWSTGDVLEYELPLPVEFVRCNPKVYNNAGRFALKRGPVIYCLEEFDNGLLPSQMEIPAGQTFSLKTLFIDGFPVTAVTGKATITEAPENDDLYFIGRQRKQQGHFTAVPYAFWANRDEGSMSVWLREQF